MRAIVLSLVLAGLPSSLFAHPGSGIVVDSRGQVYFVDMVSGVWKLDSQGHLAHLPGPAYHWMTLDPEGRFGATALPTGSGSDLARIGRDPMLLLASDFPIALGPNGTLYFPSHGEIPLRLRTLSPGGETGVLATLPASTSHGPLRWINGIVVAADGAVYYSEDDAIRRIRSDGRITTVVERLAPADCGSRRPMLQGLTISAAGNLYVADTGCGLVLEVSANGAVRVLPQVAHPWSPTGVALAGGDLYVLEFENPASDDRHAMIPRIRRIAANGATRVVATVTRH